MKMKKLLALIFAGTVMCMTVACGNEKNAEGFDTTYEITVVSREDGSGTRGAFVELFGIEQKNRLDKIYGVRWYAVLTLYSCDISCHLYGLL